MKLSSAKYFNAQVPQSTVAQSEYRLKFVSWSVVENGSRERNKPDDDNESCLLMQLNIQCVRLVPRPRGSLGTRLPVCTHIHVLLYSRISRTRVPENTEDTLQSFVSVIDSQTRTTSYCQRN